MASSDSKVYFCGYTKGKPFDHLERLLTRGAFPEVVPKDKPVAVKLHMGELGNIRYIRPAFVSRIVEIIKNHGGKPFLFETAGAYRGGRETKEKYLRTAAGNGFVEASVGAPVVVTDDSDEHVALPVPRRVDDCHLTQIKVPAALMESAGVVVLSHFKGHEIAGCGGAIKNMGMGCVSTETKREEHLVNRPVFGNEKDCNGCAKCVEDCPSKALKLVDGKPQRDAVECTNCGICLYHCPSHCWVFPPGSSQKLQVCLAHTASALISSYKGKMAFINFIQDVTPECDCAPHSGKPVVPDVGIAFSFDPVAVDKASLDLVDRAPIFPGATTAAPPDLLGKIHHTSSLFQLKTAAKLGVGSLDYELIPV